MDAIFDNSAQRLICAQEYLDVLGTPFESGISKGR